MSRPSSSHRPNHITLPSGPFVRLSPSGSPLPSPNPTSPASPRSSFLPSFMRNRNRASTITGRGTSPSVEAANPFATSPPPVANNRDGGGVTRSVSTPVTGGLVNGTAPAPATPAATAPSGTTPTAPVTDDKTYRIRLVPHLETTRSLAFDPVVRVVYPIVVPAGGSPSVAAASVTSSGPLVNGKPPAVLLKIGRFTDKVTPAPAQNGAGSSARPASGIGGPTITIAGGGGDLTNNRVAFKSKVVSRTHAEIWCEPGGRFFIKDTSSSSGTFLNHIRLSSPNTDSKPMALNDGDILQLGVDYQGGHEDMFRCVKIRVEIGREWQRAANEFNTNAMNQLRALGGVETKGKAVDTPSKKRANVTDCCICLFSVTVCQSLFIAPCSHVFHYKCIRPLLMQHHPGFSCPLCRTFANLEEDVETEDAWEIASRRASVISRKPSNHSIRLPHADATNLTPGSNAPAGPPSSGVGFGDASASVDELLSGNGGESGTASEEGVPPANAQDDTVNTTENEADAVMASPPPSGPVDYLSVPRHPADEMQTPGFFDVQTPINETFLSTLAPGIPLAAVAEDAPSVHQRLELAEQIEEGSTRVQAEGSGSGSAAGSRRASGQPDGVPKDTPVAEEAEGREDVDMLYS